MCAALFLQALAVALIRWRLGRSWLRHPVAQLVLATVAYHGLSQVILMIPSIRAWDISRLGVAQEYIDEATFVMSVSLLIMVVCYLVTRSGETVSAGRVEDSSRVARTLDWRLLTVISAPLAVLTYEGRGYNSAIPSIQKTVPTDLAATFLTVLLVLAVFGFLLKHGMKWFIIAIIIQSVLLAAAGERLPIIADIVTLLVLLSMVGLRPSRRQVWISLALTVVAVLGLTGYRTAAGRELYHQNSGLMSRAAALGTGLYELTHSSSQKDTPLAWLVR